MELMLTARGQFTFNKSLMQHLGVQAGEKVSIKKLPDGKIEIQAKKNKISSDELFSRLRTLAPSLNPGNRTCSTEEIDAAIAKGYATAGMQGL
ncbi:MAG: type II toxin-antitoxin system PrlF family antitoxin [Burkholderiaceae bacterium]|jgi:antitoxin component of MazEF toxin-antitoxin module|nr:type II toxin-antitoxin system PrlF family antitoxin [Burkholderiaceae bacterium]